MVGQGVGAVISAMLMVSMTTTKMGEGASESVPASASGSFEDGLLCAYAVETFNNLVEPRMHEYETPKGRTRIAANKGREGVAAGDGDGDGGENGDDGADIIVCGTSQSLIGSENLAMRIVESGAITPILLAIKFSLPGSANQQYIDHDYDYGDDGDGDGVTDDDGAGAAAGDGWGGGAGWRGRVQLHGMEALTRLVRQYTPTCGLLLSEGIFTLLHDLADIDTSKIVYANADDHATGDTAAAGGGGGPASRPTADRNSVGSSNSGKVVVVDNRASRILAVSWGEIADTSTTTTSTTGTTTGGGGGEHHFGVAGGGDATVVWYTML
jgi:hypothetical protein